MRKRDHSIWSIAVWSWVLTTLLQIPMPVVHDHERLDESLEWSGLLPQHLLVAHQQHDQSGWHLHFCPLRAQGDDLPAGGDPCLPDEAAGESPLVESRDEAPVRSCLAAGWSVAAWTGALCREPVVASAPDVVTWLTALSGQPPLRVLICVARC